MPRSEYNRKPETVQAIQWTDLSTGNEILASLGENAKFTYDIDVSNDPVFIDIATFAGLVRLRLTDWLVVAADGLLVRMTDSEFQNVFEDVEGD